MKRIMAVVISLILLFSITGCSTDAFKAYREAREKTSGITQGHLIQEIIIENKYNTEGLSDEDIKELSYFNQIQSKMDIVFKEDKENTKIISRNYFNLGGLGFDSAFYKDKERMYIKTPILGKYVVLDEFLENGEKIDIFGDRDNEGNQFEEQIISKIGEIWVGVLKEKDVVSGKKTLLSTEDGEVKATEFSIDPSEEQIKELMKEVATLLSANEEFKQMIALVYGNNKEEKIETESIFQDFINKIDDINVSGFKYTGYIDIDGYITQEEISLIISNEKAKSKEIKESNISIKIKNLSIEREQAFDFPDLNENNTLDIEYLKGGMPFMLEGFFNKTEGGAK